MTQDTERERLAREHAKTTIDVRGPGWKERPVTLETAHLAGWDACAKVLGEELERKSYLLGAAVADKDALKREVDELRSCPNESWECQKESRTLRKERDEARAEAERLAQINATTFKAEQLLCRQIEEARAEAATANAQLNVLKDAHKQSGEYIAALKEDCHRYREALVRISEMSPRDKGATYAEHLSRAVVTASAALSQPGTSQEGR